MFYYTMYFTAAYAAILALVCFILKEKRHIKTVCIVLLVIIAVINAVGAEEDNLLKNFSLYNNILSSREITVYYEGKAEPVSFDFLPEQRLYSLDHLEDAPVYAKNDDVVSVCWLKFQRSDKNFTEMVQLCELKSPGAYPSHVSFAYEGKFYCFLSDRFLYKNAFYCMNRDYVQELLRLIMELPAE